MVWVEDIEDDENSRLNSMTTRSSGALDNGSASSWQSGPQIVQTQYDWTYDSLPEEPCWIPIFESWAAQAWAHEADAAFAKVKAGSQT